MLLRIRRIGVRNGRQQRADYRNRNERKSERPLTVISCVQNCSRRYIKKQNRFTDNKYIYIRIHERIIVT